MVDHSISDYRPTELTAVMRAYRERICLPGTDDGKDWCDLAWDARNRKQDLDNKILTAMYIPRGTLPPTWGMVVVQARKLRAAREMRKAIP